jgi:signal transduction histidine kinase
MGHPIYYWAWTSLDPQPYESATWRAIASLLGLVALGSSIRAGSDDRRTNCWFGIASAFGSVVLASWFYVANGGNSVWLASLCVLILLFFTITDWRFALTVTILSLICAHELVPRLGVGVWSSRQASEAFDTKACLIIGFSLFASVLTRYTDVNMRSVQMRSQMRALGVTAHEMRTPIAGMLLLTESLTERLRHLHQLHVNDDGIREALRISHDLAATCHDANEVVTTHLLNANPTKPFASRAPVALVPIARDAIESVRRSGAGRGPSIELRVLQDFVTTADRLVLRQVLVNLLNNSQNAIVLRHRMSAAGRIRVEVDRVTSGRVIVTDDGIGIAKSRLSKIFQPFYTGDPDHGHGLGLTFVEAAMAAYGGKVTVESVEGSGTSVTLEFPEATAA